MSFYRAPDNECDPEREAAWADRSFDLLGLADDEKDFEDRSVDEAAALLVGQAVGGVSIWRAQQPATCEKCARTIEVDEEFTSTWWHGGEVQNHATCSTCHPIKRAPKGRQ